MKTWRIMKGCCVKKFDDSGVVGGTISCWPWRIMYQRKTSSNMIIWPIVSRLSFGPGHWNSEGAWAVCQEFSTPNIWYEVGLGASGEEGKGSSQWPGGGRQWGWTPNCDIPGKSRSMNMNFKIRVMMLKTRGDSHIFSGDSVSRRDTYYSNWVPRLPVESPSWQHPGPVKYKHDNLK